MSAAKVSSDYDKWVFTILSFILCKNKCNLESIDLEKFIVDIKGESEAMEVECYNDLYNVFSVASFGGMY